MEYFVFNCKYEKCENKTFFVDNINRKNSNSINNINKKEEEIKEKKESKQINETINYYIYSHNKLPYL